MTVMEKMLIVIELFFQNLLLNIYQHTTVPGVIYIFKKKIISLTQSFTFLNSYLVLLVKSVFSIYIIMG